MNWVQLQSLLKKQNILLKYHFLLITIVSIILWTMSGVTTNKEDQQNYNNLGNCVYYTVVTHFTVGFGDIVPKSTLMRGITVVHIVLAFMLMAI